MQQFFIDSFGFIWALYVAFLVILCVVDRRR
jgi:hypothetical protein